jgi:hypothetical protein
MFAVATVPCGEDLAQCGAALVRLGTLGRSSLGLGHRMPGCYGLDPGDNTGTTSSVGACARSLGQLRLVLCHG